MKPHPRPCDHVYLGWASSDLAELLVIGPNMTLMFVVLICFCLSYQMGVIYGSLWGVLPSSPYITHVISRDVFGVPPCWGSVGFNHYRHPKLIQLKQKQQKLTIFTLFGWFDLDMTLRWPWLDLGVIPRWSPTSAISPCLLGLGFITFKISVSYWSKNDNISVILVHFCHIRWGVT